MKNLAFFASGSGSNVENIYNYFKENKDVRCSLILTNNPSAYVIERAKKLSIPVFTFDKNTFYKTEKLISIIKEKNIDLIVLAGFLWLVPDYFVREFEGRIINIHPALLPKYGGKGMYGDNVHKAIVDNKEKETGITIHYVNEEYDKGSTIFQKSVTVDPDDDYKAVANKVHKLEYENFPKVIEEVLREID